VSRSLDAVAAFVLRLDHFRAEEHDRIRATAGAFDQALAAIRACLDAGIYTAAQTVPEPPLLCDGALEQFLDFCRGLGIHDVMLLEPMPVRRGSPCAPLDEPSRQRLRELHLRAVRDPALPKVTTMSFLEGPQFLGCQAGFTFLYVGTNGEVFPCDFAPLSFGNIHETGLDEILARLARCIPAPSRNRPALRLRELVGDQTALPVPWDRTEAVMKDYDSGELPDLMKRILP